MENREKFVVEKACRAIITSKTASPEEIEDAKNGKVSQFHPAYIAVDELIPTNYFQDNNNFYEDLQFALFTLRRCFARYAFNGPDEIILARSTARNVMHRLFAEMPASLAHTQRDMDVITIENIDIVVPGVAGKSATYVGFDEYR